MNAIPGFPLDFADLKAGHAVPLPSHIRWLVYRDEDKFSRLVRLLDAAHGPAAIFVNSPSEMDALKDELTAEGFPVQVFSASMPQAERDALETSLSDGSLRAIITTHDCIDYITYKRLSLIVRYTLPLSLQWMLSEGMLAGRDGNESQVVLFFLRRDRDDVERLLRARYPSLNDITRVIKLIRERGLKNFGAGKPGNLVIPLGRLALKKHEGNEAEFCESVLSILKKHRYIGSFRISEGERNARISPSSAPGKPVEHGPVEAEWRKAYGELDKVEEYAFAPQCRLFSLLSILELPVPEPHCGRCDLCMERQMQWRLDKYEADVARSLLECVAELREKFGKNTVIDVLRAKVTKNVRTYSLKSAPSFGSMAGSDRKQLTALIDGLIEDGFLSVRRGLYPTLELTYWGRHAIRESEIREVVLPRLVDKTLPEKFNSELYEMLRTVRTRLAKFHDAPTFQIVPDRVLQRIVLHAPASMEELKSVSGLGETKLEKFGPPFLNAIARFRHKDQLNIFP